MLRNTLLLGETEAVEVLEQNPNYALLSIRDEGRLPLEVAGPRLDLQFHDVSRWSIRKYGYTPCHLDHARAVVEFAEYLRDNPWPQGLIVHCAAGVSRSSAALIGVTRVITGSVQSALEAFREIELRTKLAGLREWDTHPNPRLIGLLDRSLNDNGNLVRGVLNLFPRLTVVSQAEESEILADALLGDP